jgi:hypothetical protein
MGVPKGFRNNIKVKYQKIGPERRQEILDGIADNGTFLPRGVLEEDMDQTVFEFIKDDKRMSLSIDGVKVPVIFLTIQRWTEFSKTWQFSDKYKNIELPFITIVRKPDIQPGQNQAGLWNIPVSRTYTYMRVPTWDGVRRGVDLYKIPQPTAVDLTYEVRLFTNRMKDLNIFNRLVQRAYQSRQCYINVNGHPMPLHLESIGDESNIDDFENRRFYVQLFEMKLLGYILDENDFEVVPTINRKLVTLEIDESRLYENVFFEPIKNGNTAKFNFLFKAKSEPSFTFTSVYTVTITRIENIIGINRIVIWVNGVVVFDGTVLPAPIVINANDTVTVRIYKNFFSDGSFSLIGTTQ